MNNKQIVLSEIVSNIKPSASVGVMCGHYSLVIDNGDVAPGIYQSTKDPSVQRNLRQHPYSGEFPMETFLFGVDILSQCKNAKLLSLVNDWQMLPHVASDSVAGNPYRVEYYKNAGIPDVYEKIIEKVRDKKDTYVEVPKKYQMYKNTLHFSESKLRNRYDKTYKKLCSLEHGCAQEFVPFLMAAYESGLSEVIAVIPATCKIPTLNGVQETLSKLGIPITVWTVYIYDTLHIENFWDGVEVYKNGYYQMNTAFKS